MKTTIKLWVKNLLAKRKTYKVQILSGHQYWTTLRIEGYGILEVLGTGNSLDDFRDQGIHPATRYVISNKPFADAWSLVFIGRGDYLTQSRYVKKGQSSDNYLSFCDQALGALFGTIPTAIYVKEVYA
jgi:hypothetical protein